MASSFSGEDKHWAEAVEARLVAIEAALLLLAMASGQADMPPQHMALKPPSEVINQ